MLNIQKATLSDLPDLMALLHLLFEQEAEFEPNAEAQRKSLFKIISDSKIGMIWVAKNDEKTVGMVSLLFTESTALGSVVALLEDMVVLPAYRGKGIGSQLVDHAIREAKSLGCQRITLLTDLDNVKAQNFYTQRGFRSSKMMPLRLLLQ